MSLPIAITLGIIFIPIYAYFWSFILRWDNSRRARRYDFPIMSKRKYNYLLLAHGIFATILVIGAIYMSYFK
ncbi:hypothetical protein [Staphylococcus caeli]|uniref:Uncharacterized protein n=1 Tax=Staphylococcus caeli TaxID=2201815 RepID=A0A1D4PNX9_9STAP|nr:hypothetical protein [Staphylococcus caeli]SCT02655.1 Uncharacterised protein [Staphylococcus caeli]SCT24654.1 Uncharacterised protein [Staphylococcus caeli]